MGDMPDWERVADGYEMWLPMLAPATDALLTAIDAKPGMRVLDLACGTGEPGLTIARRHRDADVTGVDAADGMLTAARRKAADGGLTNIDFEAMPGEKLAFADATFDAAVCRFGLMLFDSPAAGAAELRRVLKPGGRAALSVWHAAETHPVFTKLDEVLAPYRPANDESQSARKAFRLGGDGALASLLAGAGFTGVSVEPLRYTMDFADFDALWHLVRGSGVNAAKFADVPPGESAGVKARLAEALRPYESGGGLSLPTTCLIGVAACG